MEPNEFIQNWSEEELGLAALSLNELRGTVGYRLLFQEWSQAETEALVRLTSETDTNAMIRLQGRIQGLQSAIGKLQELRDMIQAETERREQDAKERKAAEKRRNMI